MSILCQWACLRIANRRSRFSGSRRGRSARTSQGLSGEADTDRRATRWAASRNTAASVSMPASAFAQGLSVLRQGVQACPEGHTASQGAGEKKCKEKRGSLHLSGRGAQEPERCSLVTSSVCSHSPGLACRREAQSSAENPVTATLSLLPLPL